MKKRHRSTAYYEEEDARAARRKRVREYVLALVVVILGVMLTSYLAGCAAGSVPTAPTGGATVIYGPPTMPSSPSLPRDAATSGVTSVNAHGVDYSFDFAAQTLRVENRNNRRVWVTAKTGSGVVVYDGLLGIGEIEIVRTQFARGDRVSTKTRRFDPNLDLNLPSKPTPGQLFGAIGRLVVETLESSFTI